MSSNGVALHCTGVVLNECMDESRRFVSHARSQTAGWHRRSAVSPGLVFAFSLAVEFQKGFFLTGYAGSHGSGTGRILWSEKWHGRGFQCTVLRTIDGKGREREEEHGMMESDGEGTKYCTVLVVGPPVAHMILRGDVIYSVPGMGGRRDGGMVEFRDQKATQKAEPAMCSRLVM